MAHQAFLSAVALCVIQGGAKNTRRYRALPGPVFYRRAKNIFESGIRLGLLGTLGSPELYLHE